MGPLCAADLMANFLAPSAAGSPSSATKPVTVANGIKYVVGDVTEPFGDAAKTRILLHFIDDSATWPNRGVFAALSAKFKKAEDAYVKNASQLPLGESMLVRVRPKSETTGSIYVGLLVTMEKPTAAGKLPSFKAEHLEAMLQQTVDWASSNGVGSVHVARPRKDTPGLLWPIVETALVSKFIDAAIEVCTSFSLVPVLLLFFL